ncbi:MAG: ACT domain-containing protein, partial [Patescibacteria group bacterium]
THDQNIKLKKHHDQNKDIVIIKGASNVPYKFAKCCNPIPPDHFTGCVSLSGLIMIHKSSCKNIDLGVSDDKHQFIEVLWNNKSAYLTTSLFLESSDKTSIDNVLNTILKKQITIENFSTKAFEDHFETIIDINVSTKNQLNDIIITLQDIKGINKVKRQ